LKRNKPSDETIGEFLKKHFVLKEVKGKKRKVNQSTRAAWKSNVRNFARDAGRRKGRTL